MRDDVARQASEGARVVANAAKVEAAATASAVMAMGEQLEMVKRFVEKELPVQVQNAIMECIERIVVKRTEEAESDATELREMVEVLESELNSMRVDLNAMREAQSELSQRVSADEGRSKLVATTLQRVAEQLRGPSS